MSHRTTGPMPPQLFLDTFLPQHNARRRRIHKDTFKRVVPAWESRLYMCNTFINVVNTERLCPGYVLAAVDSDDPHCKPTHNTYPNIAVYREGVENHDWTSMQCFVQLHNRHWLDPYRQNFSSEQEGLEDPSYDSTDVREQLLKHASLQMGHQFRLFTFAVGIFDSRARFYRFDTSSILVSESFDYHDDPNTLAKFFLRYSAMTPTERGFDSTVTLATPTEQKLYRSHIQHYLARTKEQNLRRYPDIEKVGNEDFPVSKVQVNDVNKGVEWYLVCKPSAMPYNSTHRGRFTRGFIAVPTRDPSAHGPSTQDTEKGQLYWLKDSWRPASDEPELAMLAYLKTKGVPHLPDVICGGDILSDGKSQETINDLFSNDPDATWMRPATDIRRMIHHRIVQRLLIPLNQVESARELLRVGRDVLEAILVAYRDAHVLHQDISVGNIMLGEERSDGLKTTAILNDWDRAQGLDALSDDHRLGTWAFISTDLLQDDWRSHDVLDDIESIMWVLLFIALRYLDHEGHFDKGMFDECDTPAPGCAYQGPTGGLSKSLWIRGVFTITFSCRPVQAFFDSTREFHKQREDIARRIRLYRKKEDLDEAQRHFKETKSNLDSLLDSFDSILYDETADWSHGVIQAFTHDPTPVDPPAVYEEPPPLPSPPRNKRHREDPKEENARPVKRSRVGKDEKPAPAKPRRKRVAPVLPRKVYNLRPRKKTQ